MTTSAPELLPPRHERFVAEYLKDFNATQAYIRAGYRPRGAQSNGSKLLRRPQVAAAIEAGRLRIAQSLRVTAERMAQEYAKIAFANVDDYVTVDADGDVRVDLAKASREQRAGLLDLTIARDGEGRPRHVRIKLGKLQALDALAKRMDVFVEKPPPAITAEEHEALLDTIKTQQQALQSEREQKWAQQDELRQMRAALAEVKGQLEATGLDKPQPVPQPRPGSLQAALSVLDRPPSRHSPQGTPGRTLPQGTWIQRPPGEHHQVGPTSAEALLEWALKLDDDDDNHH